MTDKLKDHYEMKIELENPFNLHPYDKNPRKNISAVTAVMESIEKNGFNNPILINQDNVICAGHTRWMAAKNLGLKSVPVIKKEMTEQEFITFNLADNKTGEIAKWDKEALRECMDILNGLDESALEIPGFSDQEIDKIFGVHHEEVSASDEADFGDGLKVESHEDPNTLVKRLTFMFTPKQHEIVSSKLKAIKKEHGLDTQADAILKALEGFKASPKSVTKKSEVKEGGLV